MGEIKRSNLPAQHVIPLRGRDGDGRRPSEIDSLSPEEFTQAQLYADQVSIALMRNNGDGAHELVDRCLRERRDTRRMNSRYLQTPLAEIGLDVRTCNTLETERGIATIGDLMQSNFDELMATREFGPATWTKLGWCLANFASQRVLDLEGH